MDLLSLANHYLATYDTLAQVLATLYIAIAIFSGEQVSTAFKSQQPQIRINPRRYIAYLNLWQASMLLIALVLVGELYNANAFPALDNPGLKAAVGSVVLTSVVAGIFWTIYDTLVHRRIEKKFKHITGSVSRLIAWVLQQEKDEGERMKLIAVLMERTNDVDLERITLQRFSNNLMAVIAHPSRHKSTYNELLSMLRSLKGNLDKRPLDDPMYYNAFFVALHYRWAEAARERNTLHQNGLFQLTSTLAAICKELQQRSLGEGELGYHYFLQLRAFLEGNPDMHTEYFSAIGDGILEAMVLSPQQQPIWDDYAASWKISHSKPLAKQPDAAQELFLQYRTMVHRSLQLDDTVQLDTVTSIATEKLFPDIDTNAWATLITFHDAVRYYGANVNSVHSWLKHPRKFSLTTYTAPHSIFTNTHGDTDDLEAMLGTQKANTIELAKNVRLFQKQELPKIVTSIKRMRDTKALLDKDDSKRLDELEELIKQL